MGNAMYLECSRKPNRFTALSGQDAANIRNKGAAVFARLRAGQTLPKIIFAERVGWVWLTKEIADHIDWTTTPKAGRIALVQMRKAA